MDHYGVLKNFAGIREAMEKKHFEKAENLMKAIESTMCVASGVCVNNTTNTACRNSFYKVSEKLDSLTSEAMEVYQTSSGNAYSVIHFT